MKLKKTLAVLTAAAICGTGFVPVSAADDIMTFRMAADRTTVYTDELAENDAVIGGGVYIDNYSGITNMRLMLKSDAPLTIENGDFTRDPEKTDRLGEPLHMMFPKHDQADYIRYSEVTEESNIVLWYADGYIDNAVGVQEHPESSFLTFEIRVPKDTPAGDYQCYISSDVQYNIAGQREDDFFANRGFKDLELGKDVELIPVVIAVRDASEKPETTTAPETTTTTTTTASETTTTTTTTTASETTTTTTTTTTSETTTTTTTTTTSETTTTTTTTTASETTTTTTTTTTSETTTTTTTTTTSETTTTATTTTTSETTTTATTTTTSETTTDTTSGTTGTSTTTTVTTTAAQPPADPDRDLNGDGKQNVADAVLLLRFLTEDADPAAKMPSERQLRAADLDRDNLLTVNDMMLLLKELHAEGD